jgi:hypothetical protein
MYFKSQNYKMLYIRGRQIVKAIVVYLKHNVGSSDINDKYEEFNPFIIYNDLVLLYFE